MKRKSYIAIIKQRKELFSNLIEYQRQRKDLNKKILETKNSLDALDNYVVQEIK